jgi:hypothetical protein
MSRESRVAWVPWTPSDLPEDVSSASPGNSHVRGWEKIDFQNEPVRREFPPQIKERLKELPEAFQRNSAEAWQVVCDLENDPENAVQDPKVLTLIRELAASGLIGSVYLHERTRTLWPDAPRAQDCLPPWLQKDFLKKHGLKQEVVALDDVQQSEVLTGFQALINGLPYRDLPHGRYFELSPIPRTSSEPRQYKYYIEGVALHDSLQSGALAKAVQELQTELGLGLECKLFEGDRLVIYGKGDIDRANALTKILSKYGISGRGPAQDVWEVVCKEDGSREMNVKYSNDGALGDGGKLPDVLGYELQAYTAKDFFEWYIKVCAFTGKKPTEPYCTSFIYALGAAVGRERKDVLQQAEVLTGYPAVYAQRRSVLLGV